MSSSVKFTFVSVPEKTTNLFIHKAVKDYLVKWSVKGHMSFQYYSFNEQFNTYNKQEFVQAFFKDPNVYNTLNITTDCKKWLPVGTPLVNVEVENVPCTITNVNFFDRLFDENHQIIRNGSGDIIQCLEEQFGDNFIIGDKLRTMLLDPESGVYNIYTESERNQFIFRLFKFVCLGGQWCQYEDNVKPYIDAVKVLYKELLRVERVSGTDELVIRSVVLKVAGESEDTKLKIPENIENPQNFLYLIIDPFTRQMITFYHQWDGIFVS